MKKKVYKIEFIQYTNGLRNNVSDGGVLGSTKYVNTEDLLIFEDEIEYYRQFGKGIQELIFVDEMIVEDDTN